MKKNLTWTILKITCSIILLAYLFYKADLKSLLKIFVKINPAWFMLALAVSLIANLIMCWRWYYLIKSNSPSLKLTYLQALIIFHVGLFYNNFLPSTVGGDVVKLIRLKKISQDSGLSISSVLIDRIAGLYAAVTLALIASIFKPNPYLYLILAFFAIASLSILLLLDKKVCSKILLPICRLIKKEPTALNLIKTLQFYKKNKHVLLITFITSLIFQALCNIIFYIISLSINKPIGLTPFFFIVPIISIVTLIPISINGLGVQEAALITLLSPYGYRLESVLSLSLLSQLQRLIFSLFGGAIIFFEHIFNFAKNHQSRRPVRTNIEKG